MLVAHKICLKPNNTQATYFARAAGTARFAYNWALAEWQRQYDAWKLDNTQPKPSQMALRRQLNASKKRTVSLDVGSHQECAANGDHPTGAGI